MNDRADPRTDLGVALFIIVVCLTVLWESRTIPPPGFDPLGSAPVPQAAAAIIIVLSLIVIGRAIGRWRLAAADEGWREPVSPICGRRDRRLGPHRRRSSLVMQLRATSFGLMTTVYLTATIGWLVRFRPRLLPGIVLLALVIGFGCQYVFTRIFIVDLPGL